MRYPPQFANKNRPLAVVTTATSWNEPPQFRHQVTRQLIRHYNVLFIERIVASSVLDCVQHHCEQINENLIRYRPPQLPKMLMRFYAYIPLFHTVVDWLSRKNIEKCVKALGYSNATLINFQFGFEQIMKSPLFHPKVYLCNDDFPGQLAYQWQRAIFFKYEDNVIRRADCCLVHSMPLYERFKSKHANVHLLLPGHEFNLSTPPMQAGRKKQEGNRISVCYMGYFDNRILIDWLINVLSNRNISLYIVGPVCDSAGISRLSTFDNFKLLPPAEGSALQSLLEEMDVCIIPFDTSLPVVQACTPNKLFQYIACGKPVVTSNMPQLVQLPDKFVYVADNAVEFEKCILRSHEEDCRELVEQRIDIARRNSWDARGDQLLAILQSFAPS